VLLALVTLAAVFAIQYKYQWTELQRVYPLPSKPSATGRAGEE